MNKYLIQHIQEKLHINFSPKITKIFGGDMNYTFKYEFPENIFFIKINIKENINIFYNEYIALNKIANTNTIRVPRPILYGSFESYSYLIMEYIDLTKKTKNANISMGMSLAYMHKLKMPYFGYYYENNNQIYDNFNQLFIDRLIKKINIAKKKDAPRDMVNKTYKLIDNIDKYLNHHPSSSLLHGDLWSGNFSAINDEAIIYDPASYYGDREIDIAMSELFGGFSIEFYDNYNKILPLEDGYKKRKTIYNLDPIINHFNLFGGGYDTQAINMLDNILK
jgi:fructosamine-3-kinase